MMVRLTVIAVLAWSMSTGAVEAEELLSNDWFETEVVIFAPADLTTRETADTDAARQLPRQLVALVDRDIAEDLAPAALIELRRPIFEQARMVLELANPDPPDWLLAPLPDALPVPAAEFEPEPRQAAEAPVDAVEAAAASSADPFADRLAASEPPPLTAVERVRAEVESFETQLLEQSNRWSSSALRLRSEARRLRRSSDWVVLHHGKWLQSVPAREMPEPLYVRLGERLRDGRFRIEGTITVTLGRYLHFATELWLHHPESLPVPFAGVPFVASPLERYYRLSESRRMRSDELHHLDHPALGVLVRIDPVALPAELVRSIALLEEPKENSN